MGNLRPSLAEGYRRLLFSIPFVGFTQTMLGGYPSLPLVPIPTLFSCRRYRLHAGVSYLGPSVGCGAGPFVIGKVSGSGATVYIPQASKVSVEGLTFPILPSFPREVFNLDGRMSMSLTGGYYLAPSNVAPFFFYFYRSKVCVRP